MTESVPDDLWRDAEATVTECRYQFAGLGNMAFGFSTAKKFRIAFEYRVDGVQYTGSFQSEAAVAQGERLAVRYNPLRPAENSLHAMAAAPATGSRGPLLAFGVAGSVLLSLVWMAVLRGCQ